jgi:hypothetical protein
MKLNLKSKLFCTALLYYLLYNFHLIFQLLKYIHFFRIKKSILFFLNFKILFKPNNFSSFSVKDLIKIYINR